MKGKNPKLNLSIENTVIQLAVISLQVAGCVIMPPVERRRK
jgi:hypothetical protein